MSCHHHFVIVRATDNLIERRQCVRCGRTEHDILVINRDTLWPRSSATSRNVPVTNKE